MQELKELLSLETKFRVKHRLFAKVSFVMANHGISGNDTKDHLDVPGSLDRRKSASTPSVIDNINEAPSAAFAITSGKAI